MAGLFEGFKEVAHLVGYTIMPGGGWKSGVNHEYHYTAMLPDISWNIHDRRVLEAIRDTPRSRFVPAEQLEFAEDDRPLPIGRGQTISQPYIVAYMSEVLQIEPQSRVLELGTGSGYQTAILARLAAEVFSIERIAELAGTAAQRLEEMGYRNIHLRHGDGSQGWPEEAPFDRIIVTAACRESPPALSEQLARGGRMIYPLGRHNMQYLTLLTRDRNGHLANRTLLAVRFVPFLKGLA